MVLSPTGPNAGSARLLGIRESNQALAELKTKLEFALSRLNDQDTQRTGVEEIREFLQTLYPDWFPMVISCIGEAGANLKPLGRCESVKLLGLLAELHGDAVVPLLQRILQVVLTRLQDADLHLREACAETVFRLTRSLVLDAEGSPVFATLLKPLFGALSEHNKWVQIGSASCICAVIQGSPPVVLSENLVRLCSRLVQHLSLPLAMARPQLLSACIHVMQAVDGPEFDEVLPSLMPCLESCLNSSSDWQTRKQAVEVLQSIGDHPELGQSLQIALALDSSARPTPLQRRLSSLLEGLRDDKVRAVREAVKDVLVRWSITAKASAQSSALTGASRAEPGASGDRHGGMLVRSSSPSVGRASSPAPASSGETSGSFSAPAPRQVRAARPAAHDRQATSSGDSGQAEDRPAERLSSAPESASRLDKDFAAEKAARSVAVKNALSGADLNSTKKPRPKRERVSIFNQKANSSFFQSANQQPGLGGDDVEDVVVGVAVPGPPEDRGISPSSSAAERPEASQGGTKGSGADHPEVASPRTSVVHKSSAQAKPAAPDEESRIDGAEALTSDSPIGLEGPGSERSDSPPVQSQGKRAVAPVAPGRAEVMDDSEVLHSAEPASAASEVQQPTKASWAWEEPARSEPSGSPGPSNPASSARRDSGRQPRSPRPAQQQPSQKSRQDVDFLTAQIEALSERLSALEEDKQRSERHLSERLQQLTRSYESQKEIIASQQQRLESQEQQLQLLDERVAQQEDELANMDQLLQEQQLLLQQQDQRLEQDDQQLKEHQQQLEQQEQDIEKHEALLTDVLVTNAASSGSGLKQSRPQAWGEDVAQASRGTAPPPLPMAIGADAVGSVGAGGALAGSSIERPNAVAGFRDGGLHQASDGVIKPLQKQGLGHLWESVLELCSERRFLEAYKQVIAEPEESCLLRLMQHTGPIVDRLDAESNSRLIRRLIHILSSPSKEPASASIEQIFSWLWQALNQGIHFTASQVEDLVSALQRVTSSNSPLSTSEKAEAAQLLQQVSALRR